MEGNVNWKTKGKESKKYKMLNPKNINNQNAELR